MKKTNLTAYVLLGLTLILSSSLFAQEQNPDNQEFVTQNDLDELMADYDQALDDIDEQISLMDSLRPGARNFMLSGYMTMGYSDPVDGSSEFSAGFSPIFLWRVREDILVEAEFEAGLGEGEIGVEYAQLLYVLNDFVTVGVGKFLSPLGQFTERYHPSWINKLPDAPLYAGHDGLIPGSLVGAQVRGGIRTGQSQWKYVLFVANGPQEGHGGSPGEPEFAFEADGVDVSQNKAFGGRLSFLPVHWLEFGVSGYSGRPSEPTGENAGDLSLFLFDFAAHDDTPWGYLRVDGEIVSAEFDSGSAETWGGGYVQGALRPSFGSKGPSDFEGVLRYDWLDFPTGIPSAMEPSRWTAGLNYWLDESTVIKLAVETLDVDGENQNTILLQAAIGF